MWSHNNLNRFKYNRNFDGFFQYFLHYSFRPEWQRVKRMELIGLKMHLYSNILVITQKSTNGIIFCLSNSSVLHNTSLCMTLMCIRCFFQWQTDIFVTRTGITTSNFSFKSNGMPVVVMMVLRWNQKSFKKVTNWRFCLPSAYNISNFFFFGWYCIYMQLQVLLSTAPPVIHSCFVINQAFQTLLKGWCVSAVVLTSLILIPSQVEEMSLKLA